MYAGGGGGAAVAACCCSCVWATMLPLNRARGDAASASAWMGWFWSGSVDGGAPSSLASPASLVFMLRQSNGESCLEYPSILYTSSGHRTGRDEWGLWWQCWIAIVNKPGSAVDYRVECGDHCRLSARSIMAVESSGFASTSSELLPCVCMHALLLVCIAVSAIELRAVSCGR